MNKGFKSIILVLVLILALALRLSACDEPEYYSVNVTSNLPGNQSVQAYVSAPKEAKGYQKGETAYVYANVAPGSNLSVESVVANETTLTVDNEGRYPVIDDTLGVMRDFGDRNDVVVNMWQRAKSGAHVDANLWFVILAIVLAVGVCVALYFSVEALKLRPRKIK